MFQVASIGVGGMGGNTMMSVLQHPKVRIVGMCDVDAKTLALAQRGESSRRKELQDPAAKERLGEAAVFRDYREMLAKLGDSIDAVTIGTPDHMHASIAVAALRAKKHVYLQKPLTHHLHEARILGQEAAKAGVTTQMGTQGHSSIETSLAVDLIKSGAIGKVKEVFFDLFKGALAVFLLEMGLIVARQAGELRRQGLFIIAFGLLMPVASSAAGVACGVLLGLSTGGVALLATLAASASYIAVPATMRHALPEANPALSLAAVLGVTFPFNILVGIPLYYELAAQVSGVVR